MSESIGARWCKKIVGTKAELENLLKNTSYHKLDEDGLVAFRVVGDVPDTSVLCTPQEVYKLEEARLSRQGLHA